MREKDDHERTEEPEDLDEWIFAEQEYRVSER